MSTTTTTTPSSTGTGTGTATSSASVESSNPLTVTYHTIPVEVTSNTPHPNQSLGCHHIFYRTAGIPSSTQNNTLILIHGFPSSSHMYRSLIPLLANKFYCIAPDLPGFGNTQSPPRSQFNYTFDNLTTVIDTFLHTLHIEKYSLYVFDYGAPVGYRLAVRNPSKIQCIITQNGNAYVEGLSDGWLPAQRYWNDASLENRTAVKQFLTPDTTMSMYLHGVPSRHLNKISPDGYTLDITYMNLPPLHRHEMIDIQLDLWYDYRTNVASYPQWQEYFRRHQPFLLAVWGQYDGFFLPPGAEAYKRDIPNAQVYFLDTGHFALETHSDEIARYIHNFFDSTVFQQQKGSSSASEVKSMASHADDDTDSMRVKEKHVNTGSEQKGE